MAWCARIHVWNEGCKSPNHRIFRTYAWLTWDDSRGSKTNFLKFMAATFTKCTCIRGSHSFHQTNTSWASMKKMLTQVSSTRLMFNMNHGGDKMLVMGSTATHQNFHITGIPPLCEHGDSIGQTKRCNGVCSRDQPRVRQHYEHRWYWFDLTIAHTQIKVLTWQQIQQLTMRTNR